MMKKLLTISTILLISFSVPLSAQIVKGLGYNQELKKAGESRLKSTAVKSIFTPPYPDTTHYFFDDFYYYYKSVYPNPALWQDNYAFINSAYADSMISLGVATLDAVDENGDVWAVDERLTPSDTLTSIPIDLSDVSENLFLSFFIEAGGKGDAPELKDTLNLEFFNKDSLTWESVWSIKGYASTSFDQKIVDIPANMQSDSFMFRFTNVTSLDQKVAPGNAESALSNGDMWHIDYVQLRAVPDTNAMKALNDITFSDLIDQTHKDYYSIPWDHLRYSNGGRRATIDMQIRTIFPEKTDALDVKRIGETFNIYKGKQEFLNVTDTTQSSHEPVLVRDFRESLNPLYEYDPGQKYGHFLRMASFVTDNNPQYEYNDTAILVEKFLDYYAMDDGTAEYSFGLPGNGGVTMQFAQLYTFFSSPQTGPDTLSAIDFYFAKTRNNAHGELEFTPVIWSCKSENEVLYPDEILYPKVGNVDTFPRYQPDTTLGFNEFMRIQLEEDLIVPDTVFVGFVQYGTDFLSLGYDISVNNKQKMRFNSGTGWAIPKYSIPSGTVMIRPVFDHKVFTPIKETIEPEYLNIYPNPARDYITLPLEQLAGEISNYTIQIIDILGKTVYQEKINSERIEIAHLNPGMFLIRLINQNNNKVYTQKFIKKD